ncbi:hypothetical protein MPLDJ20_20282 [Mesorhizobium plurifarium]|uniref:Uncharacterized protein n=1 Tax=Mesorhizobium plurifarium TaxID=69974 RepID=A0A090EVY8_MESPL|nr:hypothetical protein MPLDJ20_20282 [Mesorhizobium plurifarium]
MPATRARLTAQQFGRISRPASNICDKLHVLIGNRTKKVDGPRPMIAELQYFAADQSLRMKASLDIDSSLVF